MGQTAGKPHHFSFQGLLVSHQHIEACLQTVVEYNPWFPDKGSFDIEFGTRLKRMLNKPLDGEKNIPIDLWLLWALIKAVILSFQGNPSLPDIQQQAEHLLYEYELDDETFQKTNT